LLLAVSAFVGGRISVVRPPVRHRGLDRAPHAGQVVRQVRGDQVRPHRHHSTPNIDPNTCGNNSALGCDHAADGGADAVVHVRHDRDVLMDERHLRNVEQLIQGCCLELHALDPRLDWCAVVDLENLRFAHC
jgi:hypothetical protein